MKKLLLILLCLPMIGFGQNEYHIDEVTTPNDTLTYLKKDMSLVSGVVFSKYENGQLMSVEQFNQDIPTKGDKYLLSAFCWDENGNKIDCE